jgi:hypothetical protein
MNHKQLVLEGDKGGGIRGFARRIIAFAPCCTVKDEVMNITVGGLEDHVQFPTEFGYRAAGIAMEILLIYCNLCVNIPTSNPIEGAVVQHVVVVAGSTVKAVQSVLELN